MQVSNTRGLQKNIIDKYISIIKEYVDMMNETKITKETLYSVSNMFIGICTINRVFEYVMTKTKNIEKACYYSKKSSYYYLEYIEQIHSTNLYQNLNHMDVVMFVYKKTIFDLNSPDSAYGTMNNILSLNNDTFVMEDNVLRGLLNKIIKITNVIFYWENTDITFLERRHLCHNYLERALGHCACQNRNSIKNINIIEHAFLCIERVQEKVRIPYEKYAILLNETLDYIETRKKNRSEQNYDNSDLLLKFIVHEDELHENFHNKTIKTFVNWMLL